VLDFVYGYFAQLIKVLLLFKGHFPANFPLKHQQKDLRLALQMGESLEQPLHVAGAANEVTDSLYT